MVRNFRFRLDVIGRFVFMAASYINEKFNSAFAEVLRIGK